MKPGDRSTSSTHADLLAAYVDAVDELEPAERAAVERYVAADPARKDELDQLAAVIAQVKHEQPRPAVEPDWPPWPRVSARPATKHCQAENRAPRRCPSMRDCGRARPTFWPG